MNKFLAPLVLAALATAAGAQTVVYEDDFESGTATGFSSGPVATAPNNSTKFLGEFSASSTTLTLSGLDAHTQVTLEFDLYTMLTWDGNSAFGPDILRFQADGVSFLDANFSMGSYAQQTYSDATPLGGGPFTDRTGADATSTLGYSGGSGTTDATYNLLFTFSHTASTLTLTFQGLNLQGVGDESWGLDNFRVTTNANPVPEPASLAILGLGVLPLLRRRRNAPTP